MIYSHYISTRLLIYEHVFIKFRIVQEIFKEVYGNGYTTTASMEQLLCENCDRYVFFFKYNPLIFLIYLSL